MSTTAETNNSPTPDLPLDPLLDVLAHRQDGEVLPQYVPDMVRNRLRDDKNIVVSRFVNDELARQALAAASVPVEQPVETRRIAAGHWLRQFLTHIRKA
jgi:hypothetical protein